MMPDQLPYDAEQADLWGEVVEADEDFIKVRVSPDSPSRGVAGMMMLMFVDDKHPIMQAHGAVVREEHRRMLSGLNLDDASRHEGEES